MQDKANKYPLFEDIEDLELRAWNSFQCMKNITEDLGVEQGEGYYGKLSSEVRLAISLILTEIKRVGLDSFKSRLNQRLGGKIEDISYT